MLKKCIVIMVMLTLVAGAAFAQVTFGGQLQEGMTLFSGNNVSDADVNMGGTYNATYHEAKFSALFGDGTAGGRLVWTLNDKKMWGWMQWRPNQFFRVKIGTDADGEEGFPQIIGWGFTGEAKNSVAAVNDYQGGLYMDYRNSGLNYGAYDTGMDAFGLQLSFWPTDLLRINIFFKGFDSAEEVSVKLAKMQIYASYKIEEIGTIRFAAVGNGGLGRKEETKEVQVYTEYGDPKVDKNGLLVTDTVVTKTGVKDGADIGTLHLAFYSNEIVQGLAFELGGQLNLPHLNESDTFGAIRVGGGINLTATDPFNLKVRFGTMFGGKTKGEDNEKTGFAIGLLPSYKLAKMTIFFHAGLGVEQADKDADAITQWFINPYVWVPMGGMRMWIGFQLQDQGKRADDDAQQYKWAIPFGFNFYF